MRIHEEDLLIKISEVGDLGGILKKLLGMYSAMKSYAYNFVYLKLQGYFQPNMGCKNGNMVGIVL